MLSTVLVAGASGMLGRQIAQELLASGANVRLMLRGGANHPKAQELSDLVAKGASIVSGDVTVAASLEEAVKGADVVISALQGGPEIIVDGQVALATAAQHAGVKRFFPTDFAVDFRSIEIDEHVFLGQRKQADLLISELGIDTYNVYNGMFIDILLAPFINLIDWENQVVNYWGDASQKYDFTHTSDVAKFVARAAIDEQTVPGEQNIYSDSLSPKELAALSSKIAGKPFTLNQLGSLEDLDATLAATQNEFPEDPMQWAGFQYLRLMASGRGKLASNVIKQHLDNPMSVSDFLRLAR